MDDYQQEFGTLKNPQSQNLLQLLGFMENDQNLHLADPLSQCWAAAYILATVKTETGTSGPLIEMPGYGWPDLCTSGFYNERFFQLALRHLM